MAAKSGTQTTREAGTRETTARKSTETKGRKPDPKARSTTNPRVIRRRAERRGGTPATVEGTRCAGDPAGLLRIDFPGSSGAGALTPISRDDSFATFDAARLVFLDQDQTSDGQPSRFCKFISMETAEETSGGGDDRLSSRNGNDVSSHVDCDGRAGCAAPPGRVRPPAQGPFGWPVRARSTGITPRFEPSAFLSVEKRPGARYNGRTPDAVTTPRPGFVR